MIEYFPFPQDIIEMICGEIKIVEEQSDYHYGYYCVDDDFISLNETRSINPKYLLIAAHEAFHALRFRTKAISKSELISDSKKEELIVQDLAEKWCLENLDPDLIDHNKIIEFSNEFKGVF
jgi:hypothetical protein